MSSNSTVNEVQSLVKSQIDEILKKYNKVENTSYVEVQKFEIRESTDFDEGMLSIYFLTADCKKNINEEETDNGNKSLSSITLLTWMLKIPMQDFSDEETMENFRKERVLYNSLLAKFPILPDRSCVPKCLMVYPHMIVLENVCNMGYSINCVHLLRLSSQQLLSVLKSVAQMHASSLFSENVNPSLYKNLTGFLKEKLFKTESVWFCTGLVALLEVAEVHPKYTKEQKSIIESEMYVHMIEASQLLDVSKTYRNVLCYRPGPNTNIMLKTSSGDGNEMSVENAMLLDLYQCIYAPPAIDLLCIMAIYLDRDEQVANERDYLDYYYNELVENLKIMSSKQGEVVGISKEELLESYEKYRLFGMIYRAFHMTVSHVPKDMLDINYVYIKRSPQLLEYMEKNKEFQLAMLQCVEDVVDNLLANFPLKEEPLMQEFGTNSESLIKDEN